MVVMMRWFGVVVSLLLLVGCFHRSWQPHPVAELAGVASDQPIVVLDNDVIYAVKVDRIENGRLVGQLRGAWKRPTGTWTNDIAGGNESVEGLARRYGWSPTAVPSGEPFAIDLARVQLVYVAERRVHVLDTVGVVVIGVLVLVSLPIIILIASGCSADPCG
jgi:hypothetical protein